jgi:signal transduction histidine kinase
MNDQSSADKPMLSTIEIGLAGLAYLRLELRTPLNTIIGYSEMLREDAQKSGQEEFQLGFIRLHKLGQKMLATGNSILEASKHETGMLELGLENLLGNLRPALRPMVNDLHAVCAQLIKRGLESGQEGIVTDLRKIQAAGEKLDSVLDAAVPNPLMSSGFQRAVPVIRPTKSEHPTPKAEPSTMLVVDGNETNLDLLSRQLHREGHTVFAAQTSAAALQMMRGRQFDLILLSVMMPEMNGYQVLEQLKADAVWREVPVIMTSALDELESVVRCLELGAEDYLAKPFNPILLQARIGACLEKKRLRDQQRAYVEQLQDNQEKQAKLIEELAAANRELAETMGRLKATQDQLIVQEKLASLGALTAGIAHEIKNPLNFVNNFAALSVEIAGELQEEVLLQRGKIDPKPLTYIEELLHDLRQNAGKIHEHGKRADSIVRSMLLHSRGQSGEWQMSDLNGLLEEYVQLAYHGMRAQDVSFSLAIKTDYDPAARPVNVMPQGLSRVFLNLLNNACYATHEKRRALGDGFSPGLSVSTRDLSDRVEIRIRDNGFGIPPDVREKIFNPFFTTKPPGQGTGLGLSISYEIVVREHKGDIRVETEAGTFTEFIVIIPRREI